MQIKKLPILNLLILSSHKSYCLMIHKHIYKEVLENHLLDLKKKKEVHSEVVGSKEVLLEIVKEWVDLENPNQVSSLYQENRVFIDQQPLLLELMISEQVILHQLDQELMLQEIFFKNLQIRVLQEVSSIPPLQEVVQH